MLYFIYSGEIDVNVWHDVIFQGMEGWLGGHTLITFIIVSYVHNTFKSCRMKEELLGGDIGWWRLQLPHKTRTIKRVKEEVVAWKKLYYAIKETTIA